MCQTDEAGDFIPHVEKLLWSTPCEREENPPGLSHDQGCFQRTEFLGPGEGISSAQAAPLGDAAQPGENTGPEDGAGAWGLQLSELAIVCCAVPSHMWQAEIN